jgi:minor histocompatibility antigen H13
MLRVPALTRRAGDIVIPGIFLALMLRMDVARAAAAPKKGPKPARYFQASVVGYALGLGTTIGVMNVWNAAQPALLYIVPAVLGAVLGRAALLGEFMAVLHWSEEAEDKSGSEGEQENAEGWVKLSNSKKVK